MANYKDKKYRGSSNKMKNDKDLGIDDLKLVSFSSLSTNEVLCYNGTNWVNGTVSGGGDVVDDTTPQLGGNLDLNGNTINGTGNLDISNGTIKLAGNYPTGNGNVALGCLAGNSIGGSVQSTTFIGNRAGTNSDHPAINNTAVGHFALACNTAGPDNTAVGSQAIQSVTGTCNVGLGRCAGHAITSGNNNIVIGAYSAASSATVSNEITLGNSSITSLRIPGLQSGATDGDVLTFCSANGNIVLKAAGGGGGSISCFSYDSGSSALVATADLTSTCSALFGDVLISGNTITPDDSNTVTCLGADGTLNISGNLDVQGDFLKLPQATNCSTIAGNTASAGALRYNTTTNTIQVHNGTEFTGITGGGGGLGDLTTAVTTGSANSCETTIQSPTDENIVLDPQGTGTTCVLGNLVVSCDVTSSSDERLKENIMPIENALNVVTAMSGKTFSMKDDESKRCKIGFIAQQIEEHLPHVVATDKDGMKSVDYGKITALLVEAIKELNKKIEDMK
jgi:hypothetical protein